MSKRNYWPVALISIPFAAVLFGIVMVSLASVYPDDVVVDQYYKEGMAINERIADSENAKKLNIGAIIHLDGPRLKVDIDGSVNSLHQLSFHHVTDQNRDVTINLVKQSDGFSAVQTTDIQKALSLPGVWYVDLESVEQEWRLSKRLETPVDVIRLGASDD